MFQFFASLADKASLGENEERERERMCVSERQSECVRERERDI